MTDFHTHILPGIDDGSRSVEASLAMLRAEAAQGVSHVVLTPHFYPWKDSPEAFLERRAEAMEALQAAVNEQPDAESFPQLHLGAEVHYFDGIAGSEALSQLTIDGKRCILIEMPQGVWPERMLRELEAIHTERGLIPVLAHLDRYLGWLNAAALPRKLAALPVLIQVNASFFLQRSTRKTALHLLENGAVHLLGSDCHNTESRAPNLAAAQDVIVRYTDGHALECLQARARKLLEK